MDTAEGISERSPIDDLKADLNLSRAKRKVLDRVASEHSGAPLREIMSRFAYAWGDIGHRLDEPDDVERADMFQMPFDSGRTEVFLNIVHDQVTSAERTTSHYIAIFSDGELVDQQAYSDMYQAYLPYAVKATVPPDMEPPGRTWAKDLDL